MRNIINGNLGNEHIAKLVEFLQLDMIKSGLPKKDSIRLSMLLEEGLLNSQSFYGDEKKIYSEWNLRFSRRTLTIYIPGEPYNPYNLDGSESSEIIFQLMSNQTFIPVWSYHNGVNQITLSYKEVKQPVSPFIMLVVSVLCALVLSGICKLLPGSVSAFLSEGITIPIYNRFLGVLSAISGPLIFLSIICGIYGIGDMASLSFTGKRIVSRFLIMTLITTVISVLFIFPFYSITSGEGGSFNFTQIFNMLLDIIPTNILTPFVDNNPLQIIFLATVIGVTALALSEKTALVTKLIEELYNIVQVIMEIINKGIPILIFLSLFNLVLQGSTTYFLSGWELLLQVILAIFISLAFYTALVCIRKKVSPLVLWKKIFPVFFTALTTASSAGVLSLNMDVCREKLGIQDKIVNIGVPLGQVIFKISVSTTFFCVGLYMAKMHEVSITVSWLLTALIVSFMLAVAAPPVAGGALVCYAMLMSQLGIPEEAVSLCCMFNVIFDYFMTGGNVSLLQMELIEIAGSLDEIDVNVLRK